ncbi:hypothetical protein [Sphingobacterium sp. UME9]|uniref:hypothetical protein n=1 Tax=Sphingobacterium sp. UME9 TaxID=1862316 RepID=UPI001600DA79|nr:hypothetical protein [Sphingobacterium sp. UME9]MBB1643069.1 hypothetical protein [Sphingobacterium sp. UME9]
MTKKISEVSIRQIAFGNRQIEGFSSGFWETDEIIVGDNEIESFFYVLLFPSDKDVYSSGCAVSEFELCFAFTGQLYQWKFKKKTIVNYLIIDNSIIDNIPFLSSSAINLLKQFPVIKLTNDEFDIVQYEFNKIHQEMNTPDMLKGIIYARIANIFGETCRFIQNRYDTE